MGGWVDGWMDGWAGQSFGHKWCKTLKVLRKKLKEDMEFIIISVTQNNRVP